MRRPTAPIQTIPAALHSNAGTAISCARRWRLMASLCTKPNGGTSITKTGSDTASATCRSSRSALNRDHNLEKSGNESDIDDSHLACFFRDRVAADLVVRLVFSQ